MPDLTTFVCVFVYFLIGINAGAADSAPPFVASFERFARHTTITSEAGGRLLLTELSCTACHVTKEPGLQPKQGPILDGVADRLNAAWVREYLLSPNHAKPGTTMPDLLASLPSSQRTAAVESLSAFLSSLHKPFPEIKATGANPVPMEFWDRGNSDRGKEIYHQIGCVACHQADATYEVSAIAPSPIDKLLTQLEPDEIAEMGLEAAARKVESVPHPNLAAKYTMRGLTHFLLKPQDTWPAGRMPDFALSVVDAAHLTAYLVMRPASDSTVATSKKADADLVAKGRKLFREIGCASCHQVKGLSPSPVAMPLRELRLDAKVSCLHDSRPGMPVYAFDDAQAQAIQRVLKDSQAKSMSNVLDTHLLKLNCYACHDRNGAGGVGRYRRPFFETVRNVDIGDEGRLPPSLTGVGNKLAKATFKTIFAGKGRIRPHMHIRMPNYPSALTKNLPDAFTKVDLKLPPGSDKDAFGKTADVIDAGRALMDVGCVQCHSFRGESLPGTIGVDLAGVTSRVNPRWFRDFLRNPGSLKQRTRMPTFFPNGKSQAKAILNGDMDRQIGAMWEYLKHLTRQPLPEKIVQARNKDYELTPQEQPIILRTFMQSAGTHAIAVGFPEKVHFAFDSENIRLAEAWRGRFLDAKGTWFERFTPVADPLGEKRIIFPHGPPFAFPGDAEESWPSDSESANYRFRGYRIHPDGIPVFLYRVGGVNIEDQIQPHEANSLMRTFKLIASESSDDHAKAMWFRVHAGKKLKLVSPKSYTDEAGLTVTLMKGLHTAAGFRRSADHDEWIIPMMKPDALEIKVHYSW